MHLAKSSKKALFLLVCLHLCFAAGSHSVISPIWHSIKSSWKACEKGCQSTPAQSHRVCSVCARYVLLASEPAQDLVIEYVRKPDPRISYSSRRSMLMLGVRTHRFPFRSVTAWLLRGIRSSCLWPDHFREV